MSKITSRIFSCSTGKHVIVALLLTVLHCSSLRAAEADRWDELKVAFFGQSVINAGDEIITMEAPARAHDAATVPIVIKAVSPERQVRKIHLFVDQNPLPLAGVFSFRDAAKGWKALETRIRIDEYTNVRAVAELDSGELYMAQRFVKASGGCSAPAMADLDAAMARAGKMKILFDKINSSEDRSGASAVIKISHPNNSGMQFDQISRNYIPAFFIHTIVAELGGEPLLDVETNFSLSENPVIRLDFMPEVGDKKLNVYAIDSQGNRYQHSFYSPN